MENMLVVKFSGVSVKPFCCLVIEEEFLFVEKLLVNDLAWEGLAGAGVVIEVNRLFCFPFSLIIWNILLVVRLSHYFYSVAASTPVVGENLTIYKYASAQRKYLEMKNRTEFPLTHYP